MAQQGADAYLGGPAVDDDEAGRFEGLQGFLDLLDG